VVSYLPFGLWIAGICLGIFACIRCVYGVYHGQPFRSLGETRELRGPAARAAYSLTAMVAAALTLWLQYGAWKACR
jgi:hypothetical protein